jgi:hypothetical protein
MKTISRPAAKPAKKLKMLCAFAPLREKITA